MVKLDDNGPTSAANYAQRVAERKRAVQAAKTDMPVSGEPLPEGKLAELTSQKVFAPPPPPGSPGPTGVGSAYQVNQEMVRGSGPPRGVSVAEAMKMRPDQARGEGQPLKQETLEALRLAKDAADSENDVHGRLGDADKEIAERDKNEELPFDFDAIIEARNPLYNKERRAVIESRLAPLDIEDLIMKKEIIQLIPIIPGKFELELRTISQNENLWIEQHLYEHPGSDRYVTELHSTFKLVCALVSVNNQRLPDHRKDVGTRQEHVDRDKFEEKMFHVASHPVQIIADFGAQCNWFNDRVNALFSVENLKNG
jgi:hypothetical protein